MSEYGKRKDGGADRRTTLGRSVSLADDLSRRSEMTQQMIEAGIRAYGSDDARSTPERVLDIWLAMNDAAAVRQPPGATLEMQSICPHPEKCEMRDWDDERAPAAIALLEKIEKILVEDTNAEEHPCCGWGPLLAEVRNVLNSGAATP